MFAVKLCGITLFFAGLGMIWKFWPTRSAITPKLKPMYDYVIVGAGSAGCVLANRLSENGKHTVALLEAGEEEINYPMNEVPIAAADMQTTDAVWGYYTVSQNNSCLSFKENKSYWPTGKMLGGTSSINYLMYMRGSPHDYDEWAEMGLEDWNYESVLPYFIKAETQKNPNYVKTEYHGSLGPITVSDTLTSPRLTNAFLGAAKELGYQLVDVNGENQMGVMQAQYTADWGRRMSTAKAYLRPVLKRRNLNVATETHVTKILIKKGKAIGVEYKRNNTIRQVHARKEVILSAGTVGSAQLLMLSGIGPKDHLESLKIPVIADLPVGDNLQDHIWTDALTYYLKEPVSIVGKKAKSLWSLIDFFIFGAGWLASSGLEGSGFFRSEYQPKEDKYPHLQLVLHAMLFGNNKERLRDVQNKFNMEKEVFSALHGKAFDREGVTLLPVLLKPKSKGYIRLNKTDPFHPPSINPNYLEYKYDSDVLLDGIRLGQTLMDTKRMKYLGASPMRRSHPRCKEYSYDSDAYWKCYIKHNTFTFHHPVGTCKMGKADDPTAVVDEQLRVRGIDRLRIVDGSVIPRIPSGNLNAPIIMIAEKASDIIRGEITVGVPTEEEKWEEHRRHYHTEF